MAKGQNKVEKVWVATNEQFARKDKAQLELRGFRVTKSRLPSGSILLVGDRIRSSVGGTIWQF